MGPGDNWDEDFDWHSQIADEHARERELEREREESLMNDDWGSDDD
jgi:hypothetical protein